MNWKLYLKCKGGGVYYFTSPGKGEGVIYPGAGARWAWRLYLAPNPVPGMKGLTYGYEVSKQEAMRRVEETFNLIDEY